MEEAIKKLITPFTERTKSPFYSTFIVSWLIVNWRLVYFVFTNEIYTKGMHKFDSLEYYTSLFSCHGVIYLMVLPLLITILYIFILPIIDLKIFKYSEEKKRQRLVEKYTITRRHTVSGDEHIDLLLEYRNQKGTLANIFSEVEKKESQFSELQREIQTKESDKLNLVTLLNNQRELVQKQQVDYSTISNSNISIILKGRYLRVSKDIISRKINSESLYFDNNNYIAVDEDKETRKFQCLFTKFDIQTNNLSFILRGIHKNNSNFLLTYELHRIDNANLHFSGTEKLFSTNNTDIEFKVDYISYELENLIRKFELTKEL